MIDDKDRYIPLLLIMFNCTTLPYAHQEWETNNGVRPKGSKSKLKPDTPDGSNYFNYKKDDGKNTSCYTATGRKWLTSPGNADKYVCVKNTWNTLPESNLQRVYKNTLPTVKREIQLAENRTPAVVISMEVVSVDNAIHLDYLTSEVALEESEIENTDANIQRDNNCMEDELHFRMLGGSRDYEDEADESH